MEIDRTNWRTEKILSTAEAAEVAARLREEGRRIVTVNGGFDLLHAGHLDQLEEAKKQGDALFVGINSDAAIKSEKGEGRPVVAEQARAAMLAALACVDYVVVMEGAYDDEPHGSFLPAVKPHVHANGPDRGEAETWMEWSVMHNLGVEGYTVTRRNDFSTTDLIGKMCNS
jgi:D-glycero-beta-D-manno-heptose 1-phosphate adenylyltransferase